MFSREAPLDASETSTCYPCPVARNRLPASTFEERQPGYARYPSQEASLEYERALPVDAIAAAILGALVGALFVLFQGEGNVVVAAATGGGVFGALGLVRWLNRLGRRRVS